MPRSLPLALMLAVAACGEEPQEQPVAPPPPPPPPAPIIAPRAVSTPAAFDLVVVSDGAALVWGPPASDGGGVRVRGLDPLGGPRGEEHTVWSGQPSETMPVPPDTMELAAAAGGGRLGIVWVGREAREVNARATHGADDGGAFAPSELLGEVEPPGSPGQRGRVAAAASGDGTVAIRWREGPARCPNRRRGCVGFGAKRLGASPGSRRDGMPLSVAAPCDRALPGQLWANGVWYYGVCQNDPTAGQLTTVYAIQFEPEYARADPVLAGCTPLGLAPLGDGVVTLGECGDRVDATVFFEAGAERHTMSAVNRQLECEDTRPVIVLSPRSGVARRQQLSAPVVRIEAVLPTSIAPAGSRAVWTGESILVAQPVAREVSLRRYQCRDGVLARSDQQ